MCEAPARGRSARPLHFLPPLVVALILAAPLEARIERSTSPDGTLEFRNSPNRKNSVAPAALGSPYDPLIERITSEEGVDCRLVKCLIKIESDFKAGAVSKAGAMGLMQLMQDVARSYGVRDPFDPEENVRAGVRHLRSLLADFGGDITLALAAYHAGAGRVKRHGAVPPIQSTIRYVSDVLRLYDGREHDEVEGKVRRLYTRIRRDGTIEIFGR